MRAFYSRRRPAQGRTSGFTIIELMIATMIFSIILVVITSAILQFSRQYYKGVIASSTQGTARAIIDDVTRAIQFNGGDVILPAAGPVKRICIGNAKRYSFQLGKQVTDNNPNSGGATNQSYHGLVSDTLVSGSCNVTTPPFDVTSQDITALNNGRELLGEHMRLSDFSITSTSATAPYIVKIRVVYGDDDLLTNPTGTNANCNPGAGSQFCAVSELTTTIERRVSK